VIDGVPIADGNGDYDVSSFSSSAAVINQFVDVGLETLVFDPTGCPADAEEIGALEFTGAFEAQTEGLSSFIIQKAGAFALGVQIASLSVLLTYLY